MSAHYPFGRVTYSEYLLVNSFIRDGAGDIRRAGGRVAAPIESCASVARNAVPDQPELIVATDEALCDEFGHRFDAVNRTLDWGFKVVSQGLDSARSSIEDLNANFGYGLGLLLTQLQARGQSLLVVAERLDEIHKTRENLSLKQAREFYRAGCERLERGLLDKAIEAFLKSEEKNDTDFLTQLQLGRLYLYGKDKDGDVIDLEQARNHLLLAARFGKAEIGFLPEASASTGEALLHAAISCFVLASEAQLAGDTASSRGGLEESVRLAQEAASLRPSLGAAHYQAASCLALLGRAKEAVRSFRRAVATDRKYGLRVMDDPLFAEMRLDVVNLLRKIRDEFLARAKESLVAKRREIESFVYCGDEAKSARRELDTQLGKVEEMLSHNALLDNAQALSIMDRITINVGRTGVPRKLDSFFEYGGNGTDGQFSPDGALFAHLKSYPQAVQLSDVHARREIATLGILSEKAENAELAFSPNGSLLACSDDNAVRLWDLHSLREVATLRGHAEAVNSLAFSPDGSLLASGGGEVKLWDVLQGREIGTIPMSSVKAFSPDSSLLGGSQKDGTLMLWHVYQCRENASFPVGKWGGFSPDGSLFAYAPAATPRVINLWDVHEGCNVATLPWHSEGWTWLEFSPDGTLLAGTQWKGSGTITLWDVRAAQEIATLPGHPGDTRFITFSPDSSLLASGGGVRKDHTIKLWDVQRRREVATLSDPSYPYLGVSGGTFSPDGSLFACACGGRHGIIFWEVPLEGILPRVGWDRVESVRRKHREVAEERARKIDEAAVEQTRKAREAAEERARKAREAAEVARMETAKAQLVFDRSRAGLCIHCGTKLSLLRRMSGKADCGHC
jgi:WD40 repeat protein